MADNHPALLHSKAPNCDGMDGHAPFCGVPNTKSSPQKGHPAMFNILRKTFTIITLSITLVMGGLGNNVRPAHADQHTNNGEEVAAVIAGLVALYVIGRAIENHNDRRDRQPTTAHTPQPHPVVPHLVAPAQCRREFHTANGVRRGYGYRCMQRHVAQPSLLPDQCVRQVYTDRGPRNLYGGRCLTQNGWVRG